MEPLVLNHRPGQVVEAEIQRRLRSPVCLHPSSPLRGFFLVLSFGRCKFRLTEGNVSQILHSVIGGDVSAYCLLPLGDRVFRFSVFSSAVGFHIYKLRKYECAQFKIFFNLWHNGGPDHASEFRRWELEQASEWQHVSRRGPPPSSSVPLTGANRVPLRERRPFSSISKLNPGPNHSGNHVRQSRPSWAPAVFSSNRQLPGLLGKQPFLARSFFPGKRGPTLSQNKAPNHHFTSYTGKPSPPPISVPWKLSWKVTAPEFIDDDEDEVVPPPIVTLSSDLLQSSAVEPSTAPPPQSTILASVPGGECESMIPVFSKLKRIIHVPWQQKPPPPKLPSSQSPQEMAFRLVDPEPFMPQGAQRRIVPGRPVMRRVVTGPIAQRNNDLAIAYFQPMQQGPINFMAIHNVIDDFLRGRDIGYRSIQPCPFGQAYVRFNYIFERDNLIDMGQIPHGNGTITFIPHNEAWNNRTTLMTHDVWILMLGLNLDLWTLPLIDKAVSSFGRLLIWEEDQFYQSRAVVRVRVSSLDEIPWFFVFTEGTHFESPSWSVQCEILQGRMLGGGPGDEQFPPDDDDFDPNQFHYHGFGQIGQGPPLSPEHFAPPMPNPDLLAAVGWGVWPQNAENPPQDNPVVAAAGPAEIPAALGNNFVQNDLVLEPIEEVVQAPGFVVQIPAVATNEDVLAMDDNTDQSEEIEMPPLIDDHEEEMPEFPNMQNLQPMLVEEVPLEDLVEFADLAPPAPLPEGPPIQMDNLHLGFVDAYVPPVDPAMFLNKYPSSPSPTTIRMWAKFFNSVDQALPSVTIPTLWMNFFTLLLLKDSTFDWAKEFLQTSGWNLVASSFADGNSFTFSLPCSKPSVLLSELFCPHSDLASDSNHSSLLFLDDGLDDLDVAGSGSTVTDPTLFNKAFDSAAPVDQMLPAVQIPSDQSPQASMDQLMPAVQTPQASPTEVHATPKGKRGKPLHISEAELRRSDRLHGISRGYKSPVCKDKNCVGCTDPPLLSASVVRDLGTSFCQIDPAALTDEKLAAKQPNAGAVGRPKSKKAKTATEDKKEADGKAEKKSKPNKNKVLKVGSEEPSQKQADALAQKKKKSSKSKTSKDGPEESDQQPKKGNH